MASLPYAYPLEMTGQTIGDLRVGLRLRLIDPAIWELSMLPLSFTIYNSIA